jgi:hypothetical protein
MNIDPRPDPSRPPSKEIPLSKIIRQTHRWLSILFTAGVVGYMIVMTKGQPPAWVGLFALVPLILLLASGLYMFVLPYAAKGRSARRAEG